MSTKYIASNWRLPNEENSNKSDNYGLSFDGTEFIDCGSNLFNNSTISSISISCWIKTTSGSSNAIISKDLATAGNKNFMLQLSGNDLYWQTSTDGASFQNLQLTNAEFDLLDGNWHNIIATYNAGSTSADGEKLIYVDGILRKTDPAATLNNIYNTTSVDINIGRKGDATRFFSGSISELSIFDYALSSTQISTLYGSSELGSTSPMAIKRQPVGYWPLGDNSASNPLTQPNEAVEDASVFDFDGGANTYIDLGTNEILFDSTQPFSCSVWCKVDSYSSPQYPALFSFKTDQSTGFIMFLSHTGSYKGINFGSDNNFLRRLAGNQSDIPLNTWFHIVLTYDGVDRTSASSYKVYLNTSEKTQVNSGAFAACPNENNIGGGNATNTRFNGQISNAQIWNTKLSDSEIETLYNSGVPLLTGTQPQASNLRAWYKLDQSANWEADSSGNWQIPDAVSAYPQSFDFTGVNGVYVDAGNDSSINFTSAFSTGLWFKTSSTATMYTSHGATGDIKYFLQFGGSVNRLRLQIYDGTGTVLQVDNTQSTFYDNNWHHIAFTTDGTTSADKVIVYFDGQPLSTKGTLPNNGIKSTAGSLKIGAYTTTQNTFDGQLSNFQTWDTELSSSQIETLYNNGVPLTTAIATDNLKGWWKLDNTATFSTNWSIPDASGNGNTGTSSGMTEQNLVNNNVSALNGESNGMTSASLVLSDLTRAVPYDSYSFNFDGSNDYIQTGGLTINNTFTFSCWLNVDSFSLANQCFLSSPNYYTSGFNGNFIIRLNNNTTINFYSYDGTGSEEGITCTVPTIDTGSWHHFALTNDGSTAQYYWDGLPITTTGVNTKGLDNLSAGLIIGDNITNNNNAFNGKISNVSIFNEELTSTEVLKLYSNGVPQDLANFNPQPVAFYPLGSNSFWNGSQWTVRDMIGSNDGTGQNIGVDGLVGDSPRSSANGVGTNNSIPENLVGTTKWSSNNSYSINMSSTARVEDTP